MLGLILIRVCLETVSWLSTKERYKLIRLFSFSYIVLLTMSVISYSIEVVHNKNQNYDTFIEFINNGKFDENFYKRTLIGFVSGIVFGIIDNMGLWFGMDELDPILPKGMLSKAGFSNAYADTVSAFLAAFIANIIQNVTGVKSKAPLWANAIGMFTGCIFGVFVSKAITGRE